MLQNGRKRIHATYPDGRECIEEFCARTDDLLLRKWRKKTALGAWGEWEYEVGEPPRLVVAAGGRASSGGSGLSGAGSGPSLAASDVLLAESATNPVVVRKDTRSHFVWRIRNLPWPKSTYSVSLDESASRIVVRTSNRKYFVRLAVADMERAGLPLQDTSLAFDWGSNTLVVMYAKPAKMLEIEQRYREERQRMLTGSGEAPPKEGDVQCNPS
nr:hypothetical protein HK105_005847 [Polyrhizophydium stewartii]